MLQMLPFPQVFSLRIPHDGQAKDLRLPMDQGSPFTPGLDAIISPSSGEMAEWTKAPAC